MYQPRPYQAQALRAIAKARTSGQKRALVVMASGLGKTVVAGFDIRRFMRANPGTKVLYLCDQNYILRQAREDLVANILPKKYTHGFMIGDEHDIHDVDVLYASFQTMHRHRTMFRRSEFDYIVVDESHHGPARTYLPTLQYFRPKFMLAITATPDRMDQQDISKIYGEPVFKLELEDAWARGLLSPVDYRVVTDEWQHIEILETPVGKLSIKQLNKTLFVPPRDEEIVRIIEEKLLGIVNPRVVIFSPRIGHAERITDLMPGALALHSRLSATEQSDRLAAFRRGDYRAISTVDMFNEGIDVPEANVIVFLRSTASRTIFFQQLGRGLRLSGSKKQVLVLDFVANCDRLVILEDLRRGVNDQLTRLRSTSRMGEAPIVVDTGEFDFNEIVRDVLGVVSAIRTGYTRDELVVQLQNLARRLDRIPRVRDIVLASKAGNCASPATLNAHFGGVIPALHAAGLTGRASYRYTNAQIIRQLQQLASTLGRTPAMNDIITGNANGSVASIATISKQFGSYNKALKEAGLPLNRHVGYTPHQVIVQLQNQYLKLGRVPTKQDLSEAEGASRTTISTMFGTYEEACRQAGIQAGALTTQGAITALQELAHSLGRTPGQRDLNAAAKVGIVPSAHALNRLFGSHTAAMAAAGLEYTPQRVRTRVQMIEDLQILARSLGHTPSLREVKGASASRKCASASTYVGEFGSLNEAIEAAGLPLNRKVGYTPVDILNQLRQLHNELGRTPTVADVKAARSTTPLASVSTIASRFGTFNEALKRAGCKI